MASVGNKRHKEKCQKYKQDGRREINKELKRERAKRREEYLARRREKRQSEPVESVEKKKRRRKPEPTPPYTHMTELQKWTSIMRKLDNHLQAIEKNNKNARIKGAKNKINSNEE